MKATTQHPQPRQPETGESQPIPKRNRTNPRQKFKQRIRGFLPLNIEQFLDTLPSIETITKTHHRPRPKE